MFITIFLTLLELFNFHAVLLDCSFAFLQPSSRSAPLVLLRQHRSTQKSQNWMWSVWHEWEHPCLLYQELPSDVQPLGIERHSRKRAGARELGSFLGTSSETSHWRQRGWGLTMAWQQNLTGSEEGEKEARSKTWQAPGRLELGFPSRVYGQGTCLAAVPCSWAERDSWCCWYLSAVASAFRSWLCSS